MARIAGLTLALLALLSAPAWATFPGRDGLIAFTAYVPPVGGCNVSTCPDPDLYLVNPDGTGLQKVKAAYWEPSVLQWSADGQRLASGTSRVRVIDAHGRRVVPPRVPGVRQYLSLNLLPDPGRYLVVGRRTRGAPWRLMIAGSRVRRPEVFPGTIVPPRVGYSTVLGVSPDGRGVAYLAGAKGDLGLIDLRTGRRSVIGPPPGEAPSTVDFSPDGRHIIYSTADQGVVTVGVDGRGLTRVLDDSWSYAGYSPSGDWLVGVRCDEGGACGLWRARTDGSDPVAIVPGTQLDTSGSYLFAWQPLPRG